MAGKGLQKEMKLSKELQAVTGEKKLSRGKVTKKIWDRIKKKGLQSSKDKRIIHVSKDDKLMAVFGSAVKKDREIEVRGKKIKVKAGDIFMMELAKPLGKHLS